ncbi:MAG: NADH-quinone oxidoreductase subunit C, partial [Chloroflexus aggregans]
MPELTSTELKAKLAAALPDALLEPEPIAISPP